MVHNNNNKIKLNYIGISQGTILLQEDIFFILDKICLISPVFFVKRKNNMNIFLFEYLFLLKAVDISPIL